MKTMSNQPKIVFMGTPDFAVPAFKALLDAGYRIVAVVTQPDRPKGRKRILTPPPVKEEAVKAGIPVLQPERLRHPEAVAELAAYQPDLIVTAAYGQILPKAVLDLPRYGCINIHASLLPKYRGGAPIHRAIMNGEKVTGVTIMYMEEGLDTGAMLAQVEVPIGEEDDVGTMFEKLSQAGARLLLRILPDLLAGRLKATPQNDAEATLAPNIRREEERIDWNRPARDVFNHIRGLSPWPVACTSFRGENFKIWAAKPGGPLPIHELRPGTIVGATEAGVEVACQDGTVLLTKVQPAGKKPMTAAEFVRGVTDLPGLVLGL